MSNLIFLKLGGSLLTDKSGVEAVRPDVLKRLASEIAQAWAEKKELRLLVGHGSGSFGHVAAARYDTRQGVSTAAAWRGFAQVSAAAARLNRLVTEALLDEGLPAVSLQPSASAMCEDWVIVAMATAPIRAALDAGLVPVVYGDVAFDSVRGGTIISTEEIMAYLAERLAPTWLLLAGETSGVYDRLEHIIPTISQANIGQIAGALRGSRGTDVTGGMESKVLGMLKLASAQAELRIRIFSGLVPDLLYRVLLKPDEATGTVIHK